MNDGDNDFVLAEAAACGDETAFEQIYRRHRNHVYGVCFRMAKNVSEAEDITQVVFLQLYRKIGTFRGESAFSTWLHRMTINQVLMHFRKRIVRDEKTTDDGELPLQIEIGSENHRRMKIFDKIALDKAIAKLPNGYRNVLVLHDIEGYEHEAVARILGCSIGTSKSQLHKARRKMQELLERRANPTTIAPQHLNSLTI